MALVKTLPSSHLSDKFNFGKYNGQTIAQVREADAPYLSWLASMPSVDDWSPERAKIVNVVKFLADVIGFETPSYEFFGKYGDKVRQMSVEVVSITDKGDYDVVTLTNNKYLFKVYAYKGTKFSHSLPGVGGTVTISTATVKRHDDYNGINATILTRVSIK